MLFWEHDIMPKDAIHIRMNEFNQGTIFEAEIYSNFQSHALPNNWWTTLESQVMLIGLSLSQSL